MRVCNIALTSLLMVFINTVLAQPPGNMADQKLLSAATEALKSNPHLYFYVCINAYQEPVLRGTTILQQQTPNGKHPNNPPVPFRDIVLTSFGGKPSAQAIQQLTKLCETHNQGPRGGKAPSVPVAPAAGAAFNWPDHTGDVTAQLARLQKGDVLELGKGQITLSRGVKLKKAEVVGTGVLRVELTIDEPGQSVTFERLLGISGGFVGQGPRPLTISQPKQTEKFASKGMLQFAVPPTFAHSPPKVVAVAPPPAVGGQGIPEVPTKNKEHADYVNRARSWSFSYKLDSKEFRNEPPIGDAVTAQLKKAIEQRDKSIATYQQQIEKAQRGEYTREEKVEYVDSQGRTREKTVIVDNNGINAMLSQNALLMARGTSDDMLRATIEEREYAKYALARHQYWKDTLPTQAEKFAGPLSTKPLVTLRYDKSYKSQAWERFWGKYYVKNVSGKTLHNVTFAVEHFHFSTGDNITTRQVYFVPMWKPNTELELSHEFKAYHDVPGVFYHVPKMGPINNPANPELDGIAGVLKMNLTVWADEARQASTPVKLPERAEQVAPVLLQIAEDRIMHPPYDFTGKGGLGRASTLPSNLRPLPPKRPQPAKPPLEQFTAEFLAPLLMPIIRNLPAKSEHVAKAISYLENPIAARSSTENTAQREIAGYCQSGKQYETKFSEKFGQRKLGIIFLECSTDGKTIRAELYDPANPKLTRPVSGAIVVNRRTNDPFVFLVANGPASQVVPETKNVGFVTEAKRKIDPFEAACQSYGFYLVKGQLMVTATGKLTVADATAGFSMLPSVQIDAVPADAKQLAEAQERAKSKGKQPNPPAKK